MSAESPGPKSGFKSFFSNALRPKKSRQTLRKGGSRSTTDLRQAVRPSLDDAPPMPDMAPLQVHRMKYQAQHANLDSQLGERQDYTTIIHSIGCLEMDDTTGPADIHDPNRKPGEGDIAKLSSRLWAHVAWYLDPASAASLAVSSSTLYHRLGPWYLQALEAPQNREYKMQFLIGMEISLPHHLLCFQCGRYHRRTQEGVERIRPAHVLNPLFKCPEVTNMLNPQARTRITHGRTLPFTFVQLATRAHKYGPQYGISVEDMGRRWQRDNWSHASRFFIHEGRLLMRVTSQTFAAAALPPASMRMLLFSREDYWPYFSACAHWRDGELMAVCKCALGHIPEPRDTGGLQGLEHKVKDRIAGQRFDPNSLTTLCGFCRPMRRCPECPSEYLTEVKLCEDKSDPRRLVFKQAIVVTRWTDLGDGSTPNCLQWGAINGKRDDFDSFQHYAKRGIASVFEAAFTADTLPGQRVLSMNPKKKKLGEAGDTWY
ncbi:uncharacterized protein N7443_004773 [Penicillium atrosanguineum]|uniref:Uncharacterized protein n=1 Tax=Penicillium atrosanguineum TaxID=1132637 RepID=A0A9W9Q7W1_9EURO|nr:uncharacterized protein N7443_004773 [Penicillium atrosanguineum]KAJ5133608.1 hypothetical protein N7526_004973 [Penicillium atrosanguineum]KAJ5305113.1 hypothetical protein N7443_004773 [Penicillium atrosanguineum]KAJ5324577.1 hypothetical protein N7476_003177 [Penicillium atrosanguineum]